MALTQDRTGDAVRVPEARSSMLGRAVFLLLSVAPVLASFS